MLILGLWLCGYIGQYSAGMTLIVLSLVGFVISVIQVLMNRDA